MQAGCFFLVSERKEDRSGGIMTKGETRMAHHDDDFQSTFLLVTPLHDSQPVMWPPEPHKVNMKCLTRLSSNVA